MPTPTSAPPPSGAVRSDALDPDALLALLEEARARTLLLVAPVSEADLRAQHSPLMGPILWDLGHIAHFESLWLGRNLDGPIEFVEMPGTYNPFEHPRAARAALPLPSLAALRDEMAAIRERTRAAVAALPASTSPLAEGGYVVRMVAQHEYQHGETILQTLQLKRGEPYAAPRARTLPVPPSEAAPRGMARFPGGDVVIGTDDRAEAYDNERPAHVVRLEPFDIDVTAVTNGDYLAFVEDGGYRRRELWSAEGWAWLEAARAGGDPIGAPMYWTPDPASDGWRTRVMDLERPLDPRRPVCHVCWHEAEAFARWAGKRLPTEAEWEAAASWDPVTGTRRRFPWGDAPWTPALANLDQLAFDTAPVGAYPAGVSPIGCHGMLGDVWEWTASAFRGWPGFEAFPYREYSEVFFGDEYRVLRGGSWATRPGAARSTFRNWDYPIRRQIFAGVRCARDA